MDMKQGGVCKQMQGASGGSQWRGVLFDAGNTLLRVRRSVGAVYAEVAGRFGAEADPVLLDARFHATFARLRETFLVGVSRPHSTDRERRWWRTLVAEVFRNTPAGTALAHRFDHFFAALYDEFALAKHWELFPDVIPCLDRLERRSLPVGVVSNWDSRLHPVLDGLGIGARPRFVLTSAEFGAEKPDPSIFRAGAARLGLAPGQVLYVGDSLDHDVRGAHAAGLQALWVRRGGGGPCPSNVLWAPDLRLVGSGRLS